MSKKPVSLAVHKSNIERKRRKSVRSEMMKACQGISNSGNIVAYAVVAISDDGRAFAGWDTGGVVPMWAFPSTIAQIVREDLAESGVEDDFRRPLIDRAWKGSK